MKAFNTLLEIVHNFIC